MNEFLCIRVGWHYDAQTLSNIIQLPKASVQQAWHITFDHNSAGDHLALGKVVQFRRIKQALADLKIEISRENWWATFPNVVFAAEQTPTTIGYHPDNAVQLLTDFDQHYQNALVELGKQRDIRPHMMARYTRFLSQ